jgi:hypothetical protein
MTIALRNLSAKADIAQPRALIFKQPFTATSLLFWGAPERRRMAWQFQFLAGVSDIRAAYLQDRHVAVEEVPDISVCSVR